jgi:molybdopterin/thiamine biosynthesis adenylyltransferase
VVADFCQDAGQRLVSASVTGTEGQLLCLDAETGRYTALFPEGPPPQQNCAEVGVLATSSMLMGQIAAQAALQWLVTDGRPDSQLVSTWPLRIMRLSV